MRGSQHQVNKTRNDVRLHQYYHVHCNAMQVVVIIIMFVFCYVTSVAQKVRLEGDDSEYLCLNDSLAESLKLQLTKLKVDSTIAIFYDNDNGRLQNSRRIILWTHDGTSMIRFIEGCNTLSIDTTYAINADSLWNYIHLNQFPEMTVPIKSGSGQSHDRYYKITVTTPKRSFYTVVRDNERKPSAKYQNPENDSRIMLTNKIDNLFHKAL
jgi:hypothetical protein